MRTERVGCWLGAFAVWMMCSALVAVMSLGWIIQEASGFTDGELAVRGIDGQAIEWRDGTTVRVWVFLGCECPVAKLYARRVEELQDRYRASGVEWVGVMSNLQDTQEDIARFAKEVGLTIAMVKDEDQALARKWQVTRTAEVVMVDRQGELVYRGRIDDQYSPGVTKSKVAREDLAIAIDTALRGESPQIAITEPVGCKIAFDRKFMGNREDSNIGASSANEVTYSNQVAAILNKHCMECHRPGEIGPFDITDIAELPGWSEMILEVIDNGRMPPWHADPRHGVFKNSRSMSREEVEVVRQWVRAGAPIGDTKSLQAPSIATGGWRLERDPELVVSMREAPYKIPASGTVDYQYFVVDPKIEEDRWVSAAQVIPGDPSVVHHAIVFIRPPDDAEFLGIGWLTAYVPGQMATRFPAGYARKIPAGSKFVFQMHYTPNGRPTSDLSKIGMTFVDPKTVTHEVFTVVGIDQDFEIPPGVSDHRVTARVPRFPKDGELLAVSPHMHLRGKSFELRALRGSQAETLLSVPRYDFNWQHTYEWVDRIPLADIDSLDFTVAFDNSESNPANPSAEEYVMWGDQTWEEMAVAFFEVSRPLEPSGVSAPARSISQRSEGRVSSSGAKTELMEGSSGAREYADKYLSDWDVNGDGVVSWEEAPKVLRDFGFFRVDTDNNRELSHEELMRAARKRDR